MSDDPLHRLRHLEVPSTPEDFDNQVHQYLNQHLLVFHIFEFVSQAIPVASSFFASALTALANFSMTGQYDPNNLIGERHEK